MKRGGAHVVEPARDGAGRQFRIEPCDGCPCYSRPVNYVVLEREFPEPLTSEEVRHMAASMRCLELYRVQPVCSYLMPDGKRLVCVFEAPDADALRSLGRANGFPPDSVVWASSLHIP